MDNSELNSSDAVLSPTKKANGKIPNGTITRNFFEIEELEDDEILEEKSSPTKLLDGKKDTEKVKIDSKQMKQMKKRQRSIKLKPLGNANPQVVELQGQGKGQQQNPERKEQKKQHSSKMNRLNFEIDSDQDEVEEVQISIKKVERSSPKKQPLPKRQQKRHLQPEPEANNSPRQHQHESPDQALHQNNSQQNQHPPYLESRQEDHPLTSSESPPIKIQKCQTYTMKRDASWLNKIWPVFHLHLQGNNQYCFSAKLTGKNKDVTFVVSQGKDSFVENQEGYLGKVKANFIGNVINVYGPGYNPTDFKNKKEPLREMLATVEYETNFFGTTRPRNFRAFVLKPGVSYYDDLLGPTRGEDEIPLSELYEKGSNSSKILVLQNRKPSWNDRIKGYMLNFGGRIKKASIKNFILEDEENNQNVRMIFGKLDDDQFRIDVGYPLTPLVGFGIALSTFGGKIGCQ